MIKRYFVDKLSDVKKDNQYYMYYKKHKKNEECQNCLIIEQYYEKEIELMMKERYKLLKQIQKEK